MAIRLCLSRKQSLIQNSVYSVNVGKIQKLLKLIRVYLNIALIENCLVY